MAPDPLETDSELFRRLAQPKLSVRGKSQSWPLYLGYAALGLVAIFVFMSLSRQRTGRSQTPAEPASTYAPVTATPPVAAPPVVAQAAPVMPPPVIAAPMPSLAGLMPQSGPAGATDQEARLRAPAMIIDLAREAMGGAATTSPAAAPGINPTAAMAAAGAAAAGNASPAGSARADDERFAASVAASRPETVAATRLNSTATIAPQGTIIPAVLETALNSSLPGYVRAVVSRDVRGFDGSTVLIPRGTRLIGEYKSGVAAGQTRAFVVWSRLLTPEGVSVDIGSPAVDTLGRGGVQGEANSHFLRRFGAAILMSVLNAGLEAGVNHFSHDNSTVVIGTSQQANNVASLALQRDIDIPTTIAVPQGTPIRVFVARDLDFSAAVPAAR